MAKAKKIIEKKVVELFNKEIKESYLSSYPEDTQKTYRRIFTKSSPMEFSLNKDLSDFTKDEIEEVLYDLNPLTSAVSQSNGRIITSYIAWRIGNSNKINPLRKVSGDWFDKFVDKTKKLYFTEQEIRDIEGKCENFQDKVIVRLLFLGIYGKECIEIRNIHKNDIDRDNNTLTIKEVRSEKGIISKERKIKLDDYAMRLVTEAYRETTYMKKNGKMDINEHVREFTDLVETEFLLRSSVTKSKNKKDAPDENNYGVVNSSVVYRRVGTIGETLEVPYFTTKNIFRSGVIYKGYKILERKKMLGEEAVFSKEDFIKLAEEFNINNHYTIKDYCNEEMIEDLYGIE